MTEYEFINDKMRGQNRLIVLKDIVSEAILQSSTNLDFVQMNYLIGIYDVIEQLLSWWNASIIETTQGFALIQGRRNQMIAHTTKIILEMQKLSQTDKNSQLVIEAIDDSLEELSGIILEMQNMEDSA